MVTPFGSDYVVEGKTPGERNKHMKSLPFALEILPEAIPDFALMGVELANMMIVDEVAHVFRRGDGLANKSLPQLVGDDIAERVTCKVGKEKFTFVVFGRLVGRGELVHSGRW